jgi:hypothetical protein
MSPVELELRGSVTVATERRPRLVEAELPEEAACDRGLPCGRELLSYVGLGAGIGLRR